MNRKKKSYVFPIEKKLATIEQNLKLLSTAVSTTHTPLRTFKSIMKSNIVLPTLNKLEELTDL